MAGIRLFFIKKLLLNLKGRVDYKDIAFARRGFERLVSKFNKPLAGFTYGPTEIEGLKAEWIIPQGADEGKVLLYFHGGGYATGSINTHRSLVSKIVEHAGIKALIFNYRLAPEVRYPAPIEDAATMYQYLLTNGYAASNIAFGGDSAGGGMVVGTLLWCRDKNIPLPKCAFALSPWLDHTMGGNSYKTHNDVDPMIIDVAMPLWSGNYMGESDPKSIYASPIFHDLKGLPPIYVQVGEDELLLDDSTRFKQKADTDGIDVKLEIFPGHFHVFNAFWRVLPVAREANKKLGAFLKEQLA